MNKDDKLVVFQKTMNIFIAVVCTAFLLVSINLGFFKYFIRNEAYYEGLSVVPILLIANVFLGIYYNQSVWYKLSNRTSFGAYISICGALITILLNLWLIPEYGYMASAFATLMAYFIQMVMSYYLGRKYYPIPYNTNKFFLYIGASCLIFLVFSLVRIGLGYAIDVFNQPLLLFGNGLILLYLLLVFRNEKETIRPKRVN
jgi:O-antigen/teichoic acid export membrane protein